MRGRERMKARRVHWFRQCGEPCQTGGECDISDKKRRGRRCGGCRVIYNQEARAGQNTQIIRPDLGQHSKPTPRRDGHNQAFLRVQKYCRNCKMMFTASQPGQKVLVLIGILSSNHLRRVRPAQLLLLLGPARQEAKQINGVHRCLGQSSQKLGFVSRRSLHSNIFIGFLFASPQASLSGLRRTTYACRTSYFWHSIIITLSVIKFRCFLFERH